MPAAGVVGRPGVAAAAASSAVVGGVAGTGATRRSVGRGAPRVLGDELPEARLERVEDPGDRGVDRGLVGDLEAAVEEEAAELGGGGGGVFEFFCLVVG